MELQIWQVILTFIFHYSKNHQRAMDSLQASLEAESRAKSEALRISYIFHIFFYFPRFGAIPY